MLNHSEQEPKYGTKLNAKEELAYQQWRSKLPKALQYEGDYDLRGLYKANPNVKPSANMHFPDTYKLPNHPTFSNESKYFSPLTKPHAGYWKETDSSFNYIPFDPHVKDTLIEMKGKGFVPFSRDLPTSNVAEITNNEDKKVSDWWAQYVSSPKYKERLSAFYQYPDYIQRQRADILSGLRITDNPQTRSRYWENDNELRISPLQIQALNAYRPEVVAHEMAHVASWSDKNRALALTPQEEEFIATRNKNFSPANLKRYKELSKQSAKSLSNVMPEFEHDINPNENLADIQALRFLLKQRNIYDAGKENITPDIIKKAAKDPVIRKSFSWKRLKESFDEKGLNEIMNKVAINSNKNSSNIT